MNVWDVLILFFVITLLGFAVWLNVHKKKKGNGCCGDCNECGGDCSDCGGGCCR